MRTIREAFGHSVEFIDIHVLRHRYERVCYFGWWLLNG